MKRTHTRPNPEDLETGWLDLPADEFELYLGDRKATSAEKAAALKIWRTARRRTLRIVEEARKLNL
jgi:hypothetical protein